MRLKIVLREFPGGLVISTWVFTAGATVWSLVEELRSLKLSDVAILKKEKKKKTNINSKDQSRFFVCFLSMIKLGKKQDKRLKANQQFKNIKG